MTPQQRYLIKHPNRRKASQEKYRETHQIEIKAYSKHIHQFKGTLIYHNFKVRNNTCRNCGYQGFTNLHHKFYCRCFPIACTVELCNRCHRGIHIVKNFKLGDI